MIIRRIAHRVIMGGYVMGVYDISGIVDRGLNHAVMTMCGLTVPRGFDVMDSDAPDTLASVTDYAKAHNGRLAVWGGASDRTIFGDSEIDLMFRAWHDACHIAGQFDFTLEGERKACELQIDQLRKRFAGHDRLDHWCALLRCEVIGQAEYFAKFGEFPANQELFTQRYLVGQDTSPADIHWEQRRETYNLSLGNPPE